MKVEWCGRSYGGSNNAVEVVGVTTATIVATVVAVTAVTGGDGGDGNNDGHGNNGGSDENGYIGNDSNNGGTNCSGGDDAMLMAIIVTIMEVVLLMATKGISFLFLKILRISYFHFYRNNGNNFEK